MKTFIIDTNVLINDPLAFQSFGPDNKIVIPLLVIQELDGLKTRKDSVGASARAATRAIDALRDIGKLHEGLTLPNGGNLRVHSEMNDPTFPFFGKPNADHYILQVAVEHPGSILVTEDTALRIHAEAVGVNVERYENSLVEPKNLYDSTVNLQLTTEEHNDLHVGGSCAISEESRAALAGARYAICKYEWSSSSLILKVCRHGEREWLEQVDPVSAQRIAGRNLEQIFSLDALMDPDITMVALAGQAGTGKTLLAMAAGLEQVMEQGRYERMTIARPIVSMGNELGFLPGTLEEKLNPWMGSIHDSLDRIIEKPRNAKMPISHMDMLKDQGFIEVQALQYIRGRSLPRQFVLIDEAQQLTPHEIQTIATRAGEGTKLVFCGDPYQIDSPYLDLYNNGMSFLIDRFKGQDCFAAVTLHKGERSKLAELAAKLLG